LGAAQAVCTIRTEIGKTLRHAVAVGDSVGMAITDIEIGQNVQRARYRRGWTQADLAAAVALDRSTVSRIEQGRRSPTTMAGSSWLYCWQPSP
jgi:ribosome-binding protein aMBF1 (putative translation factor)